MWGGRTIKVPKPKIDGEETNFFECKKCGSVLNFENLSNSELDNGCPNCQSKDFELKISMWNGILHYKIKECSKCHKMDMADLIKWPDSDNTKGKSKKEVIKMIKQEKLNDSDNCQCSSFQNDDNRDDNDDNRERERERERDKNGFNWKSPWVIGGGILLVVVIGLVVYFLTRKNQQE